MAGPLGDEFGFVLVDKPEGWTSHDVVAKCRHLFGMRRIGHAGTLDPSATGLLVLGVGRATRLLRFVTELSKEYVATARFGVATDTLDADGEVIDTCPMDITVDDVEAVLGRFTGLIDQTPPMVSAVKVGGQRLHALARRGIDVERPARKVTVARLSVEGFIPGRCPEVRFRVVGGAGLYVRVLADDLARVLGGRAHLRALRRLASGSIRVEDAWTMERLEKASAAGHVGEALVGADVALSHLPDIRLEEPDARRVRNGVRLVAPPEMSGWVRMMEGSRLLAVYRAEEGRLWPEVVLS